MPRFGAFTLRTECARCGQALPLNGPVKTAQCGACQTDLAIPSALWRELLVKLDDEHDDLVEGTALRFSHPFNDSAVHCSYARQSPRCDKCSRALPLDVALDAERDVTCEGCGEGLSVYPPPDWLREESPNAQQVYAYDRDGGEGGRGAVHAKVPEAPKPVVMPCPQCGGSLQVTGDAERVLKCRFCATDVFLPDDLWRRLHPVRTVREWFVRFDGETRRQRERARDERAAAEAREADAARRAKLDADSREAAAARKAREEAEERARDVEIPLLRVAAFWRVLALGAVMLLAMACGIWVLPRLGAARQAVAIFGGIVVLASVLGPLRAVTKPIERSTDRDWGYFQLVVYAPIGVALLTPLLPAFVVREAGAFTGNVGWVDWEMVGMGLAGSLLALPFAASFLTSSTLVGFSSGNRTYPRALLTRAEGKPVGLLFLVVAIVYPGAILSLGLGSRSGLASDVSQATVDAKPPAALPLADLPHAPISQPRLVDAPTVTGPLTSFDAVANLDWAKKIATAWRPEAILYNVALYLVDPDGTVNLTVADASATYRFVSPTCDRGSTPQGCGFDIIVHGNDGLSAEVQSLNLARDWNKARAPLANPTCGLGQAIASLTKARRLPPSGRYGAMLITASKGNEAWEVSFLGDGTRSPSRPTVSHVNASTCASE